MHRTILIFIITMLALAGTTHAQPDLLWSRTFGGEDWDQCRSIIQTEDGGYALAGHTASFGAGRSDFWLVRTDEDGDSLWSRTYGGEDYDECYSMIQTNDGGFALVGVTYSFGAGSGDFWLVKTDADGDSLWSRTFGGEVFEECNSMIQTTDGGYALAGYTRSFGAGAYDMWLVKTNADGDYLWSKTFGGRRMEYCNSVIQTEDGGYALAGWTESFGAGISDFWLVKTDEDGDSLWSRTFGGGEEEWCYSIIQTADGGYALAGFTYSFGGWSDDDMWLVKTNADGDSLWSKTFGGRRMEYCNSVIQTEDGGYVLAGYNIYQVYLPDSIWLYRTDDEGNLLWSLTFGGEDSEWCNSIIQTTEGGYALAGYTTSFGAGGGDFWLVKTGPDPVSVPPAPLFFHPSSFILHPSFPNPFNSTTNIRFGLPKNELVSLRIIDLTGNAVETLIDGRLPAGYHTVSWNSIDYPAGVYICNMQAADESRAVKMVLVK